MVCYYPLHAFKAKSDDTYKNKIAFKRSDSWRGEKIDLPCGQCTGCRLERARQWAVRCVHEASLYENNCFITLTYEDKKLPKNGSLVLEHFQKFMRRLRKKSVEKIRFFHCGEYGEQFSRPHYHALLFNYDFDDKELFSEKNGYRTYTSKTLSSLWTYGFSLIGDLNFESAGYVARYSLKKVTGEKAKDYYRDKRPEYCTMSRRPGIGFNWYKKYKSDVYPVDRVVVNGIELKPPRYYDNLLQKDDASTMMLLKIKRESCGEKFVKDVFKGKEIVVSDSSGERLVVKEKVKLGQLELLSRHKDGV